MTNREKFANQLLDHLEKYGSRPAMFNGELVSCGDTNCRDCDFNGHGEACATTFAEWLKSEYVKQPDIPLNTPIDTPILVWEINGETKHKRYFAGVDKNDRILAWVNGGTEWSSGGVYTSWEHAELADKN